jgi:hypothetical protein
MMVSRQTIQIALTNMSNVNAQIKQKGGSFILDP